MTIIKIYINQQIQIMKNWKNNKLSNNESGKCEGEITIEECTNAIFKMKLNKAPGLHGLKRWIL